MNRALSLALALTPAWLLGCSHTGAAPAPPPAVHARIVHSILQTAPQTIQMTGTLHARETAILSPQVPGRILRVMVQAGDRVAAGQTLAALDDTAMASALSQARAGELAAEKQQMAAETDASLAAQTLARYQILRDQKSVSPQEFDEVQKRSEAAQLRVASYAAQREEAKAAVAGAEAQLGYTILRSPFAGVVTARLADPGTLAAPGVPLLQIDRGGPLQVYTTVDESLIASVRLGAQVPVVVEGLSDAPLTGNVADIVPAADPATRTFLVRLDLPPAKDLRAGIYATAGFLAEPKPMILVPQSAVTMRGSLACVYALDPDNLAQLRYVTIGGRHGSQVEILSGVAAGESLVDVPGDRDLAGQRVISSSGVRP